jgi:hypothetical protein
VRGYAIGDRVLQPQYGTGTIRLVDEYHTVIDFERSSTVEPGKPPKRTRKKAVPKES